MKKLDNKYTRDVEQRIAVLTESINSGRHDDDKTGKISLQIARRCLEKMLDDWNNGTFSENKIAA